MTTTEELLKIAEREAEAAEEASNEADRKVFRLKEQLIFEKYGVRTGSIIRDTKGRVFKVKWVGAYYSWQKPHPQGLPQKKDGTFSIAHQYIAGDYEVIEP